MTGRSRAYEAIVKGENLNRPGIPESFKVLVRELQSIGLDITVMKTQKDGSELEVDLMSDDSAAKRASKSRALPSTDSEFLNIFTGGEG